METSIICWCPPIGRPRIHSICKDRPQRRLHLDPANTHRLYELALLSEDALFYGIQSKLIHIQPWWQRDDRLGTPAVSLTSQQPAGKAAAIDLTHVDLGKLQEEKAASAAGWRRIEELAREIALANAEDREYIRVSGTYGRICFSILEQIWRLLILEAGGRDESTRSQIRFGLREYDSLWAEWFHLEREHPCCRRSRREMPRHCGMNSSSVPINPRGPTRAGSPPGRLASGPWRPTCPECG